MLIFLFYYGINMFFAFNRMYWSPTFLKESVVTAPVLVRATTSPTSPPMEAGVCAPSTARWPRYTASHVKLMTSQERVTL